MSQIYFQRDQQKKKTIEKKDTHRGDKTNTIKCKYLN